MILWTPTELDIQRANLTRFIRDLGVDGVHDSPSLYRWSIDNPTLFWPAVWRFADIQGDMGSGAVLTNGDHMAPPPDKDGPHWFSNARLNFAENLLRYRDDRAALVAWTELGPTRTLTYAELSEAVARFAQFLRKSGVGKGDRVVAFIPNIPEAAVAMLAATSLGAIWSSCSPDFGALGVLDRFGQIAPKVIITADGYRYGGKWIDSLQRVREFLKALPSVEQVVVVEHMGATDAIESFVSETRARVWSDVIAAEDGATLHFERLPFEHPLYIMYSSGTTGLPKCMVHGAGGTLIQHMKELVLHTDLRRDDTVFYFSTCGWMMWNWLMSCLAVGSTLVLYDGAPVLRGRPILWDLAEQERISVFGTSGKWLALSEKEGSTPRTTHDLGALRVVLSTGSPLADHSFDYVYSQVKQDVRLSSISGGTDIISCFAGGDPTLPVRRGELQARALGMRVEVWNEEGKPVVGEAGELVCTEPFPSMPVEFWNDPDASKYRAAYFEFFPGVWRHGDWATLKPEGGMIIHGRSDATLNPGGVRIGTSEIYRQVEQLSEVLESLVIGQDFVSKGAPDVRIVLFVRLVPGVTLDDALRERIRARIRENVTPHHVPKKIIQVADIPRTISGKITELAVRDVVHGRPVKNRDALANPEALELFRGLPELKV
jgi:acetoacetyl-CoA synthetase